MKNTRTPIALAIGGAFALSIAASSVNAAENPFAAKSLASGYQVADNHKTKDGKCATGKCGANKKKGEKAGEGKCSAEMKEKEGKCATGKCGAEMKTKEGKCSAEKTK